MNELEILYEDKALIVCRKPSGVASQTRRLGQQDMESLLRNYRAGKGEEPYIGVVHRLDQPVEGVMVFAKTKAAAAKLSQQVQKRQMGKHYYAIGVAGHETDWEKLPQSGRLTDYMTWNPRTNVAAIVSADTPQAKKGVLDYVIKDQKEQQILFDITLHTGRHHQIRLQLAHLGFPLLGDTKYGGPANPHGTGRLALWAYRLEFIHPTTGKPMVFEINPRDAAL